MPALEDFRAETRAWLEEYYPPGARAGGRNRDDARLWRERLIGKGWSAPTWPTEYGGGGLDNEEYMVLIQELRQARAPVPFGGMGLSLIGPTLLELGTDDQKSRHLPPIVRGEVNWCQGYSEPSSGSDLASLRTRAVDNGDHFVINGQKIWTSGAQFADWMFALVRTDPDVPKHDGISFVLLTMHQPGVSIKPIRLISGSSPFCETFFDDAIAQEGGSGRRTQQGLDHRQAPAAIRAWQHGNPGRRRRRQGSGVRRWKAEAKKYAGEVATAASPTTGCAQRILTSTTSTIRRIGSPSAARSRRPRTDARPARPPRSSRCTAPSCSRTSRSCSWKCAARRALGWEGGSFEQRGNRATRVHSWPTVRRRSTAAATRSNATSSPSAYSACRIETHACPAIDARFPSPSACSLSCEVRMETEVKSDEPKPPVAEVRPSRIRPARHHNRGSVSLAEGR